MHSRNFYAFHGTCNLSTVYTRTCHWKLSSVKWINSIHSHSPSLTFILILYSYLCLHLQVVLFLTVIWLTCSTHFSINCLLYDLPWCYYSNNISWGIQHFSLSGIHFLLNTLFSTSTFYLTCVCLCIIVIWEEENQLDATQCFIELVIWSTCCGHVYAHHQELTTILLVWHVACNSGVRDAV